jgi:Cof subfamily protein (haloacid dehalogenase superfamily)
MQKKLIFLDIDNTTIYYDDSGCIVPPSAVSAVSRLIKNGHRVMFATGRSYYHCTNTAKILNIDIEGVFNNGAYAVINGEYFFEKFIPDAVVKDIISRITKENYCAFFSAKDNVYEISADAGTYAFFNAECRRDDILKPLVENLPTIYEILVYTLDNNSNSKNLISMIIDAHPEISSSDGLYSITLNDISKAVGIENVAKHLGYSMNDVIAIGDGHNDIPMLRKAGVGVAMGNAGDEVKAVADIITDDVKDDGLYKVFEQLKLI